jgi:hypothetical protein
MIKLDNEVPEWVREYMDETIKQAEEQKADGSMNSYRLGDYKKVVRKSMKIDQQLPQEVEDFLTGLQNRTLGVVPVKVKDINTYRV